MPDRHHHTNRGGRVMKVAVHQGREVGLSSAGREYVAGAVESAVGWAGTRVLSARVELPDEHTCAVTVAVAGGPPLTVRERAASLTAAVDAAARRAGRVVHAAIQRRLAHGVRRPAAVPAAVAVTLASIG